MTSAQPVRLASIAADVPSMRPEPATAAIMAPATAAIMAPARLQTVADAPMAVTAVARPEGAPLPVVAVEASEPAQAATELRDAGRVVASPAYSALEISPAASVRMPLQRVDHPGIVYLTAATRMADTQSLVVINASGGRFGLAPIRVALIRRGWSPPLVLASRRYHLAHTTIRYARADRAIARSLARTLPGRTRLVACSLGCQGVRLIIGADAVNWRFSTWARHFG